MLQYIEKNGLDNIRAGITDMAPADDSGWASKIYQATLDVMKDLKYKWWPMALAQYNGVTDSVFDENRLLAGWHYTSLDDNSFVSEDQRVFVSKEHSAGGIPGHVYKYIVPDVPYEQPLWNTDFTLSNLWLDVTDSLCDDVGTVISYRALYLIYRSIAADQKDMNTFAEQRDYFLELFGAEWETMQNRGLPRYDFNNTGGFETEEAVPTGPVTVLKVSW